VNTGNPSRNHPRYKRPVDDAVDDRCTPDAEFWAFNKRFQFTIDAAASHANARLPRYWTREDNGLEQPWAGERVWCNPPYSRLRPWFEKAWLEIKAPLIVMLVPANRTEQPPWQDLIEPFREQGGGGAPTS
jgi:phage N-6-adenine-methyltransferase